MYLAEKQTKGNWKWNEKWCEKCLLWIPWERKFRKTMRKCILHVRNSARKVKNEHFSEHFLQMKGMIWFNDLSFIFEKNGIKMKSKISQKWLKNDYCERPYCAIGCDYSRAGWSNLQNHCKIIERMSLLGKVPHRGKPSWSSPVIAWKEVDQVH